MRGGEWDVRFYSDAFCPRNITLKIFLLLVDCLLYPCWKSADRRSRVLPTLPVLSTKLHGVLALWSHSMVLLILMTGVTADTHWLSVTLVHTSQQGCVHLTGETCGFQEPALWKTDTEEKRLHLSFSALGRDRGAPCHFK